MATSSAAAATTAKGGQSYGLPNVRPFAPLVTDPTWSARSQPFDDLYVLPDINNRWLRFASPGLTTRSLALARLLARSLGFLGLYAAVRG